MSGFFHAQVRAVLAKYGARRMYFRINGRKREAVIAFPDREERDGIRYEREDYDGLWIGRPDWSKRGRELARDLKHLASMEALKEEPLTVLPFTVGE